MPTFLDHHTFCEDLPEVSSTKVFFRGKFHPNGLFSEHIFGPAKNYSCQCGYYHGPTMEGRYCNECGVPILEARSRREKFAKISLPISVINPIFYDMLKEVGGSMVIKPIEKIIREEDSVLFKTEQGDCVVESESNAPQGIETWDKLDAIYELVRVVSEDYKEDDYRWKMIHDNLDKLFISEIIVLPPELRPASVKANINELDEINRYYMQILMKREIMNQTVININRDKNLFYHYFRQLQRNINDLYKQILDKLSKKTGLIRGHILGKRVDFSGRAVIAPGPDLNIDECRIPYTMFLELFKLDISRKLIEIERFKLLNEAIEFVEECVHYGDTSLFDLCKKMINENKEVCILNRQPSLHKLSMLGFYIDISLEDVIRLHPLATPPYNADFDGDSLHSTVDIFVDNKYIENIHMSEILNLGVFDFKSQKTNNGKEIKKYSPNKEVKIKSIDPESGNTEFKNVSEFSVHDNLTMYKLEDPDNNFEPFWSSSDHSLLVFDEEKETIDKITPEDLKRNPYGKYLIQE